jgi:hypothetical protein
MYQSRYQKKQHVTDILISTCDSDGKGGGSSSEKVAITAADVPIKLLPEDLTLECLYGSFLVLYAIWFWIGRGKNQQISQAWYVIACKNTMMHRIGLVWFGLVCYIPSINWSLLRIGSMFMVRC